MSFLISEMEDGNWEIRVFRDGQLIGVPVYCGKEGLDVYLSLLMNGHSIVMEEAS